MSSTDILFTPMHIRDLEIKNRFIMCPMEGTSIVEWFRDCKFMDSSRDFYLDRAKDGVGLFIPGMTPLRSMIKDQWLWQHPEVFEPVQGFMDELHSYGAKVFFQLGAGWGRSFTLGKVFATFIEKPLLGKMAKSFINMDHLMVAPDEGSPNVWMPQYKCHGLTVEEIQEYVEAYAKTAKLCKDNGVDGVEVHAVHEGYLMDQFTLPYSNHRTDRYGGSFENRYRFAVEVVKAIKAACGEDYPVSLRYSVVSKTKGFNSGAVPGENFTEAGRTMEESERAIRYLQEAGYDAFNCDNGTYDAWYWAHPPIYMPQNCNLEYVEHIRKFVDIPVVCAGRMDPVTAAEAVARGGIDGAGFARQFLADPEWVNKLLEGREDEIRPCILCHNGCFNMAHYKGVPNDQDLSDSLNMSRCAVNAETMQWDKHYIRRTSSPKKVAIIGGGIGGMEAARVLKLRGHEPVIYEKNGMLGGTFIAASAESYKGRMRALLDWYRKQMTDLGVEIHLNTEVKDLSQFDGMPLIVSTGSTPIRLGSVKGFDRTVEACDYLLGKEVGQKVAVIGGGLTGCEIAYELFLQGKEPIIIEMKDDLIAQKGVCLANSSYLREFFEWKKVPVYLETTLREVREGSVVCTGKDGKEVEIPCDSVIGAVGYRPAPMDVKGRSQTWLIGDCSGVGNLRTVVWSAYEAAMKV